MSFVKRIFSSPSRDRSGERAAAEATRAEKARLAEAQRLEGIETKKAEELKVKTAGQAKRRLRRRAGAGTTFTSPLGISGGGTVDSKVLLGL